MGYVDLATIHNPATGGIAPASWGDQVRDNFVAIANPPRCSISHSTTQSVTNATWTAMSADTEEYDTDAMHSTVTNNSRITIVTAGLYLVTAAVSWAANATGSRGARLWLSGVAAVPGTVAQASATDSNVSTVTVTVSLSAGAYIEVQGLQRSGGALDGQLRYAQARWVATS